jgi:hypothetical protein
MNDQLHVPVTLTLGKISGGWAGPRDSVDIGKETNFLPLSGIKPKSFGRLARSLVTILTTLSQKTTSVSSYSLCCNILSATSLQNPEPSISPQPVHSSVESVKACHVFELSSHSRKRQKPCSIDMRLEKSTGSYDGSICNSSVLSNTDSSTRFNKEWGENGSLGTAANER